jgi:hypothetical protein
MLYHIPTPSRTRRTHFHHSTARARAQHTTHPPPKNARAPPRHAISHARTRRPESQAPHRTRKHEHEQSVPTASQPRDGAEYEQPLPTHVDEAPLAGLSVSHRSGAVAAAMRWRRAYVRSFGAFYTAVGTTAYPIRRIRACVRAGARAGYTWLPTYHALSTYVLLGTK